jgi:hypothetical protein
MRIDRRRGRAFGICLLVAAAACGRDPLGGKSPDASTDASGRAGTMGSTGAAGTSGVAGTTGGAGTTGASGTTGAAGGIGSVCKPGATICTGPNQAVACTPKGVWSSDNTFCPYGCDVTVCRQCAPDDTICDTPMTIQRCSPDGLRWAPPERCENGCENGTCAAHCQPGAGECVNGTDVRICRGEGVWGASVNCKFGCSNGACLTCEPSTAMCLTSKSSRRCQDDGTWGSTVTCASACMNGICTDCQPNTSMCVDGKTVRGCSSDGTWDPPSSCGDGVCIADSCRTCKPGTTQCGTSDVGGTIQTCSDDGEWLDTTFCTNVCKDGACVSNPKKVFVTSTTYKAGDLGGLAGADAKCQARATAGGLSGTFRAWLSDATSSPASRFPKDAGPYQLVTGGVVANNWITLTSGTLRHAINVTELGTAAPTASLPDCPTPIVWTDTGTDGMLADFGSTCGDWTDSSVFSVWLGTTASQVDWTASACDGARGTSAETGCGARAPIYCFEQ